MYYCSYVNLHFLHKDRRLLMDIPINNYITYYTEIVIMIMITRCNFAFFCNIFNYNFNLFFQNKFKKEEKNNPYRISQALSKRGRGRETHRQIDRQMDGWTDRQTDGRTYIQTDR